MPTKEEIREEDRKIRYLRRMVDFTYILIATGDMSRDDATRHVAGLRGFAVKLFPGKEETFDLLYGPRFKRLLVEKYRLS